VPSFDDAGGPAADSRTPTPTTAPTEATPTTPDWKETLEDRNQEKYNSIEVERVSQLTAARISNGSIDLEAVHFKNLTEGKQEAFLQAVDDPRRRAEGVRAWNDLNIMTRYVYYDGTWWYVNIRVS
jgi:exonuclease VII large subunit